MPVKNLILDWSGTVVDDLDAVIRGTNEVLLHYGKPTVTRDEFRQRFCLPWINFYKEWLSEISREDINKIFWKTMLVEQEKIQCLPYAMDFLEFTRERELPVFICTTVDVKSFSGQAERLGISPYIRKAYAGIEDKKEVIHSILEENKLHPSETMFVGDMLHDIETAHAGGVISCGILTGYDMEAKLASAKPNFLLKNLKELRLMLEKR